MNKSMAVLAAVLALLSSNIIMASPKSLVEQSQQAIDIPHIDQLVEIDGKLDDDAWNKAIRVSLNYEVSPAENLPAPVKTDALLIENGDYLYIAFVAQDPAPEQIRAYLRDRDNAWSDDLVGIKLDTYNNGHKAYEFFANPFGVQQDAIENELIGRENDAWDAIWDAAGEITDTGYKLEMAIPLRILNFDGQLDEQQWGIELVRFYPRNKRHRLSNIKKDRNLVCTLCQLGVARGFKDLTPSQQLQLVPTMTSGRHEKRTLSPNTDWQATEQQELGLDIKWGINSNSSLQATINPDFSQIEADSGQLSINDNFSLFLEEKRDFFLDNADFFETPFDNLFYTRNVIAPKAGIKVLGRQGNNSFSLFAANDEQSKLIMPGNISSTVVNLEQPGESTAIRYRFDAAENFSIGALLTGRNSDNYHNVLAGVDLKYQLTGSDTVTAQMLSSNTQYPLWLESTLEDESALRASMDDDFTGTALHLKYKHQERDWNAILEYQRKSHDYRADLGFVNQTDFQKLEAHGLRNWYRENNWWNRFMIWADMEITQNTNGQLLEKVQWAGITLFASYQSVFDTGVYKRDKVVRINENSLVIAGNSEQFSEHGGYLDISLTPTAGVDLGIYISKGNEIDHANKQLGRTTKVKPQISWNINQHLMLKLDHNYRQMDVDEGRLFKANLTDLRLVWQFNIQSFLRLSLVNVQINRNPSLYHYDQVDSEFRSLGTQLLYSYKLNPQSLIFLGYADHGYDDDNLDKLQKNERSLFMKFSYAWL